MSIDQSKPQAFERSSARRMNHIGPDFHLSLETAVTVSKEDVSDAWERSYDELGHSLRQLSPQGTLYVVFGIQGSGKTTWINNNASRMGGNCVFFDGPLPSREKRSRALAMAADARIQAVAVWVDVPLEVAFARNAARRGLAVIKEEAIRHVHAQLEPPSLDEGFARIIRVVALPSPN